VPGDISLLAQPRQFSGGALRLPAVASMLEGQVKLLDVEQDRIERKMEP
jgi:hypothetical protein